MDSGVEDAMSIASLAGTFGLSLFDAEAKLREPIIVPTIVMDFAVTALDQELVVVVALLRCDLNGLVFKAVNLVSVLVADAVLDEALVFGLEELLGCEDVCGRYSDDESSHDVPFWAFTLLLLAVSNEPKLTQIG